MKKNWLLLLLLFLACPAPVQAQFSDSTYRAAVQAFDTFLQQHAYSPNTETALIGNYTLQVAFHAANYQLTADGRYSYWSRGCLSEYVEEGYWRYEAGALYLRTKKKIKKERRFQLYRIGEQLRLIHNPAHLYPYLEAWSKHRPPHALQEFFLGILQEGVYTKE